MISRILKNLLRCKWIFKKPKEKPLLLIDGILDPLKHYYKREEYNILYRRGEEINIFVAIKCLIELNVSSKNYIKNYIFFSKPKLIVTAIHNYIGFYEISKTTGIKTMFIQNAIISEWGDLFSDKKTLDIKNKKNFKVDFMLVFNSSYGEKFQKFIEGKYFVIGSFKNNLLNVSSRSTLKNEVLFISSYKSKEYLPNKTSNIFNYNFVKNEKKLFSTISKLCQKKNMKLTILGKNLLEEDIYNEKKYFYKILDKKFKFIENHKKRPTYEILNRYKYIFTIDSTLAIENFSNGRKTGFLFNRPYVRNIRTRAFGYYEKIGRKGPFWTTYNNKAEIERVFNYVLNTNYYNWKNNIKEIQKKVMPRDSNNKKIKLIIKNEIN